MEDGESMQVTTEILKQRLEDLAREIESAAPQAADRLRNLGTATGGGNGADVWAASDIFQLVDPESIVEQVQGHGAGDRWVGVLEMLRNALVFLPIAITWVGIWRALESYADAIHTNPALSDLAFLYLWQQGFEGRTSLTLSRIALADGAILLLVFVLTIVVLWYNNQREHRAVAVREELSHALADASLVLTDRRTQQSSRTMQHLDHIAHELLDGLQQERQRIQDLATRKEKEVGDITALTRDFMTSTQGMLAAVQSLQQVPQQMSRIVAALTASFEQLTDQQRNQQQEFAQATHQAAQELRTLTESHHAISSDLQTMGDSIQKMGNSLHTMTDELREALQVSKNAALQNVQAVADMHAMAGNLAAAQTQFMASLSQERNTIERGLQGLQQTTQTLQHTAQAVEASLGSLAHMADLLVSQQREVATASQQTTTQLKHLTDSQQTMGINMQTMGINLQKMGAELTATIDVLQKSATETARAAHEIATLLPRMIQLEKLMLDGRNIQQQEAP